MLTRQHRHSLVFAVAMASVLGFGARLKASQPPDPTAQIPYTGYLQQNGAPFTGSKSMVVTLLDPGAALANQTVWTQTFGSVNINNGRFSLLIGDAATSSKITGFLDGTDPHASGQPLQVQVTVDGALLSPSQTLYAAPYSVSSGTANHSPGDFAMNGALTLTNTANNERAISFNAPGDGINGISYRPTGAPDSLAISGAGSGGSARLIRLFDNVIINGTLNILSSLTTGGITATGPITTTGQLTAGSGLKPDIDTGFFYVHSVWQDAIPALNANPSAGLTPYHNGNGDIEIFHNMNFIPTRIAIQACGTSDGVNCGTAVNIYSDVGYHDSGSDLNPAMISADNNHLTLAMLNAWWAYGVFTNQHGWVCGVNGNYCYQALWRVMAWR